ncbi:MAG: HisA/HisF-related TIM barrel protein [Gammaproteobacteria bacterium]
MQIIPVVDLKDGQVVAAVKGNRSVYQPIQSQLVSSSEPDEIVATLLNLTKSNIIYIADLNAIEGTGNHFEILLSIFSKFNYINFWIDAGFKSIDQLNSWKKIDNVKAVIGSENHTEIKTLIPLLSQDSILSLDYKNEQLIGPAEILNRPKIWPDEVIIMALDRIGNHFGPNLNLLNKIKNISPANHYFAAGGVRDQSDLDALKKVSVTGALLSTALHNKTICTDFI